MYIERTCVAIMAIEVDILVSIREQPLVIESIDPTHPDRATSQCDAQPPNSLQMRLKAVTVSEPKVPVTNSLSSDRRGVISLSCGYPVCAEFPGHGPLDNALAGDSNCQCVSAAKKANISAPASFAENIPAHRSERLAPSASTIWPSRTGMRSPGSWSMRTVSSWPSSL
jgi:hypothetical protein